jgi:predicted site-specific integrase-resolvase
MEISGSGEIVGIPSDPTLLTEAQLGQQLGVSRATVRRWRYLGCVPPYIKQKSKIFYLVEDVRAWLNKKRTPAPRERRRRHGQ